MESIVSFLKYLFKYKEKLVDRILFYISLVSVVTVVLHVGYVTDEKVLIITGQITKFMFYFLFVAETIKLGFTLWAQDRIQPYQYSGLIVLTYLFFVFAARHLSITSIIYFGRDEWMYIGIAIVFLTQLSKSSLFLDSLYFNPTIFFVISFLLLIIVGAILLLLPRTTLLAPLSIIDAFFMATSAVCITGLSVTDISTNFSFFGQMVILFLIQIGGLGIMTFTGFFGYFFSGGFSFKNQLMFGEILGENKLNEVIQTLLAIIFISLTFEAVGSIMIFFSTERQHFETFGDRVFFSIFHGISGFCNSGFTLMKDGINSEAYRYNYAFHFALSCMFILGTLGFNVIESLYHYVKNLGKRIYHTLILRKRFVHKARIFTFNAKFVLYCNITVIVLATVVFFILEYNHALKVDQTLSGKIVTSFFMANSARTAGFESIGMGFLSMPTLIVCVILMWVGSSPASTGGGVKVTTVAVAILNIVSLARGKDSIEVFRRQIVPESVSKAFAIILLSFVSITICFGLLNFTDSKQAPMDLLFESISAYTTCGLSLGATPNLSASGKIILMFTMFVGRVGMLTLLVAFIKDTKRKNYIYPTEKLLF